MPYLKCPIMSEGLYFYRIYCKWPDFYLYLEAGEKEEFRQIHDVKKMSSPSSSAKESRNHFFTSIFWYLLQ